MTDEDLDYNEDEDEDAAFEGFWARWRCINCEEINETEDDPRGSVETCTACGKQQRIGS